MGKTSQEEKSDGLEIISIGKLYRGPWDKKYWSSSRGRDRYPYPVGYKSVRSQNRVTYTMEILEGPKGPSFTISSTDGKSCCGDTPDIAWENLQKKGCSKLWHGKRFSCKIDGVEFFGFKNTFVQRLLRELVANVGGTAEQSLLLSNFSVGSSKTISQLPCKPPSPDPDVTCLAKSHLKGKRSRNQKVVNSKQQNQPPFKRRHKEKGTKNASKSNSSQGDQTNCENSKPSTLAAGNEVSVVCYSPGVLGPENLAAVKCDEKALPVAEKGMKFNSRDMSGHPKVEDSRFQEETELINSMDHIGLDGDNSQQNQEPSDRSRSLEVQELNNLIPEERGGVTNIQQDMPIVNDADIFAPDTLDNAGDSSSASPLKNNVQVHHKAKGAIVNDVAKSEDLVTDSLPEDEMHASACNASPGKCDNDLVGQEIAKSMMTVLLPRAVPLLKTFSRKKKKSAKPSNIPTHASQAIGPIEHSDLGKKNEKACFPFVGHYSVVSTSGNSNSVVPDSFDNDDPQDLLSHLDAAKSNQLLCTQDCRPLLSINDNAEASQLLSHSKHKEHLIDRHDEKKTTSSDNLKTGKSYLLNSMTDSQLGTSKTGTADDTLVALTNTILTPVEEIDPNPKRVRFDCHSIDELPSVHASKMQGTPRPESVTCRTFSDICMPEDSEASLAILHKEKDVAGRENSSPNIQIPSTSCCSSMTGDIKLNDDSRLNIQQHMKFNSKLQGPPELFACYIHPVPISMVQLIVKENEIVVCVKCGYGEHSESSLFVYKALKNGEKMGCPTLIGYLPVALQISKDVHGRDIAVEKSLFQLTPDAQSLVLLNSVKAPYCREGKLNCSCPACTPESFERNAVKIVRLNWGYATLTRKLETIQGVCCLLVCEPDFIIAAEEDGKLKLWVMNSGWSDDKEDWYLPPLNCNFPSIVELRTIPNSAILVVGQNGFGEFGLWDINKRNLVSRFSSPGISVLECIPASIFRWQRKGECQTKALVHEILDATKTWFSERSENHTFSRDDKDVAVWLLISTPSDPESQCSQSSEQEANLVGSWKLALLINNTVITGSVVDAGNAAVTSVGHGIIGTPDGLVYTWELSTGKKLQNLHSFEGSRVSCITTDTSNSGALAIASGGHLLVYLPS